MSFNRFGQHAQVSGQRAYCMIVVFCVVYDDQHTPDVYHVYQIWPNYLQHSLNLYSTLCI